jgi:hypothetical protein
LFTRFLKAVIDGNGESKMNGELTMNSRGLLSGTISYLAATVNAADLSLS